MTLSFAPGDDLIFQLESGFGLLRVIAIDEHEARCDGMRTYAKCRALWSMYRFSHLFSTSAHLLECQFHGKQTLAQCKIQAHLSAWKNDNIQYNSRQGQHCFAPIPFSTYLYVLFR